MLIYFIVFIITICILYFASYFKKHQANAIALFALLLPCILAALRASNIGTDVRVYLEPLHDLAIDSSSFANFFQQSWLYANNTRYVKDIEIGFLSLVYTNAKIFGSLAMLQFWVEAFCIYPIYFALKMHKKIPVYVGTATYLFMFYNTSLNMMRQMIAMAFVLWAVQYLLCNKKHIWFWLLTAIAFSFHNSAVLAVIIYVAYLFVQKSHLICLVLHGKSLLKISYKLLLLLLAGIVFVFGIQYFAKIIALLGFAKYANYFLGQTSIMFNQLVQRFPVIVLLLVGGKAMWGLGNMYTFLLAMLILDILFSQFTSVFTFGGRLGLFFQQFNILLFPLLSKYSHKRRLITLGIFMFLLFFWWFYFVYLGHHNTVPYQSLL
ncbi:MAG: EpsG family protein [Eubacteriales bacterium]|nr:EpsG family protein [Eubacteriales bacterium]